MADIIIGKAKVIGVEEVTLGNKGGLAGSATAVLAPEAKTIVVSKIKIEPHGATKDYTAIEGIMMFPGQLPFGKQYELTLREEKDILETNDRMFKDGE